MTGCNVGAKNTLMMTALPQARSRGAQLFTGATVLSVMPRDDNNRYRWILRLRRTASDKTPLQDEVFYLAARDVILAAGTLGSTEILMRSRDLHGLKVSGLLGKRFSGNGDAIAFGFAQRHPCAFDRQARAARGTRCRTDHYRDRAHARVRRARPVGRS